MEVVAGVAGLAPGQGRRGHQCGRRMPWGRAGPRARLTLQVATMPCPHGQVWYRGSPPAPQLHRGPECGEGSRPTGCPVLITAAMGEMVSLKPEGLCSSLVGRNPPQSWGRGSQAMCLRTGESPVLRKMLSVPECPPGRRVRPLQAAINLRRLHGRGGSLGAKWRGVMRDGGGVGGAMLLVSKYSALPYGE